MTIPFESITAFKTNQVFVATDKPSTEMDIYDRSKWYIHNVLSLTESNWSVTEQIGDKPIEIIGDELIVDPKLLQIGRPYVIRYAGAYVLARKNFDGSINLSSVDF